ncbi:MAG TPA: purine-binding chemotaxis protein CheW, partial [Mizugakiibacter sp.]|nr:purine-binding chemotaxis protein CheW [Mizugakiibacter sp.]
MAEAALPYDLLAEYERQSLAHDPGVPEQIETPGLWRGIGFRLGSYYFVSDISEVSEILTPLPMADVPGTLPWLLGVTNLRGNLVPVVDLGHFLFNEVTRSTPRTRLLVVYQPGGNVGLLVDEISGLQTLTLEQREHAEGEAHLK